MKIISLNLNGVRSAARKGFFNWMAQQNADVVCVQELKAHVEQLCDPIFSPKNYHTYYFDAQKKGYSGVGIFSRKQPKNIIRGFNSKEFDPEGRYLEIQFDHLNIVSLYAPSGSSGEDRQAAKFRFLDEFVEHLKKIKKRKRPTILCGDWNIAHKEIDLKNWRGNQKNSGFLPEERAWLDNLFYTMQYVDVFRQINQEPEQYTWWSNRGQAWTKNVGWRIDYHVASPQLKNVAKTAAIYKTQRFSDHAPLTIDYNLSL